MTEVMNLTVTQMDSGPVEDFMIWAAFRGGKPNIPQLKELTAQWIRMVTQKSSGQQPSTRKVHLSYDNCERVRMGIIAEGIMLVQSGALNGIQDGVSDSPITEKECPEWGFLYGKHRNDFQSEDSPHNCMKPRGIGANVQALRDCVERLKNANPQSSREHEKLAVLIETVALVLSGRLDDAEL